MADITIEEYAAVHAPAEIPHWFIHKPISVRPHVSPHPSLIYGSSSNHPNKDFFCNFFNSEDSEWVTEFLDPFHQEEKFKEYMNEVKEYILQRNIELENLRLWEEGNTIERFFQWRLYFAKQISSRLAKH